MRWIKVSRHDSDLGPCMSLVRSASSALVIFLSSFINCAAWAHGDWPPQHGGIMNTGGETSFELVQAATGVYFYASDHGEPLSTQGATGKLTQVRTGATITYEAKADGKERLLVKGLRVRSGERITLQVVFSAGNVAVGRFLVP